MNHRKRPIEPRQDPGHATAERGVVLLDGPDGVAVTMTPDAATRTADSLYRAADEARSQRPSQTGSAPEPEG